tara:strand:+ start:223 stop:408 length:186 start_codon:yes stop_codon:yes gene_type:complete
MQAVDKETNHKHQNNQNHEKPIIFDLVLLFVGIWAVCKHSRYEPTAYGICLPKWLQSRIKL